MSRSNEETSQPERVQPVRERAQHPESLLEVMPVFFRHFSPVALAAVMLASWCARLAVGNWTWRDALVAGVIASLWPFQEWLLHVHVLHFRPREILGRHVDLFAGKKHRTHHRNPHNLDILFIPNRVIVGGAILFPCLFILALPDLPLALTAIAVYFTFALNYEWSHFLIHTPYRPRGRRFRRIWEHHRQHHFRNENYWFGVSMTLADRILGTDPARQDVPLSKTCYTLGEEDTLGVKPV